MEIQLCPFMTASCSAWGLNSQRGMTKRGGGADLGFNLRLNLRPILFSNLSLCHLWNCWWKGADLGLILICGPCSLSIFLSQKGETGGGGGGLRINLNLICGPPPPHMLLLNLLSIVLFSDSLNSNLIHRFSVGGEIQKKPLFSVLFSR